MPFKKVGPDDYTSPSGRHFNEAQVRLWHANGNKFPGQKTAESYSGGGVVSNKGHMSKVESFAQGGEVLGRSKDFAKGVDRSKSTRFMSVKDEFRDPDEGNPGADEDNNYAKSGAGKGKGFVKPPKAAHKTGKC